MFVVVFDFHQEVDKMEDLGRGQKKYLILQSYFVRSSSCVVQHKFLSSQTNVNIELKQVNLFGKRCCCA